MLSSYMKAERLSSEGPFENEIIKPSFQRLPLPKSASSDSSPWLLLSPAASSCTPSQRTPCPSRHEPLSATRIHPSPPQASVHVAPSTGLENSPASAWLTLLTLHISTGDTVYKKPPLGACTLGPKSPTSPVTVRWKCFVSSDFPR